MTKGQEGKYWVEFNLAWKERCKCGGKPADRDAWRKGIHVRAGAVDRFGRPKKHMLLNNGDIDAVFKIFQGYSKPESLQAQLELERQPVLRAMTACEPYLDEIVMPKEKREAYVAGIYRNVQRKRVRDGARELEMHEMPDTDLGLVIAALHHTVQHKLKVPHQHPSGSGRERYDHRVGERTPDPYQPDEGPQKPEKGPKTARQADAAKQGDPFDAEAYFG